MRAFETIVKDALEASYDTPLEKRGRVIQVKGYTRADGTKVDGYTRVVGGVGGLANLSAAEQKFLRENSQSIKDPKVRAAVQGSGAHVNLKQAEVQVGKRLDAFEDKMGEKRSKGNAFQRLAQWVKKLRERSRTAQHKVLAKALTNINVEKLEHAYAHEDPAEPLDVAHHVMDLLVEHREAIATLILHNPIFKAEDGWVKPYRTKGGIMVRGHKRRKKGKKGKLIPEKKPGQSQREAANKPSERKKNQVATSVRILRTLGYKGMHLSEALKDFQKKAGLPVTGKPDDNTLKALRKKIGGVREKRDSVSGGIQTPKKPKPKKKKKKRVKGRLRPL